MAQKRQNGIHIVALGGASAASMLTGQALPVDMSGVSSGPSVLPEDTKFADSLALNASPSNGHHVGPSPMAPISGSTVGTFSEFTEDSSSVGAAKLPQATLFKVSRATDGTTFPGGFDQKNVKQDDARLVLTQHSKMKNDIVLYGLKCGSNLYSPVDFNNMYTCSLDSQGVVTNPKKVVLPKSSSKEPEKYEQVQSMMNLIFKKMAVLSQNSDVMDQLKQEVPEKKQAPSASFEKLDIRQPDGTESMKVTVRYGDDSKTFTAEELQELSVSANSPSATPATADEVGTENKPVNLHTKDLLTSDSLPNVPIPTVMNNAEDASDDSDEPKNANAEETALAWFSDATKVQATGFVLQASIAVCIYLHHRASCTFTESNEATTKMLTDLQSRLRSLQRSAAKKRSK